VSHDVTRSDDDVKEDDVKAEGNKKDGKNAEEKKKPPDERVNGSGLASDLDELHNIGCFCRIVTMDTVDDPATGQNVLRMLVFGVRRIQSTGAVEDANFLTAEVVNLYDDDYDAKDIRVQACVCKHARTHTRTHAHFLSSS